MTNVKGRGSSHRGGQGCRRDETDCLKDGGTSDRHTAAKWRDREGRKERERQGCNGRRSGSRGGGRPGDHRRCRDKSDDRGGRREERSRSRRGHRGGDSSRGHEERRRGGDRRGAEKDDRRTDKNNKYKSHRDNHRNRSPSSSEYSGGSDSRGSSSGSSGKAKSGDSNKDEIVHFSWQKGSLLDSRYRIVKLLGDGTFGRVLLAEDLMDKNRQVAVKVIRDVKRYAENAKIEADILKDIRRADPRGENTRSSIMFDQFSHNRHFCMVFQPCGASLYDFLKKNSFKGFWMQDIQSFASQSLEALAFLHGRLQMTHTDLKPENILLEAMDSPWPSEFPRESSWKEAHKSSSRSRKSSEYLRPVNSRIRLIDFGNATYEDEHHSSIINTRQYRGPEVILSVGWNELSDVWSMGCILMELYTGELLFGTHENLEHLALMEAILDQSLPASMLSKAPKAVKEKYLTNGTSQLRLAWPEKASSSSSGRHVKNQRTLYRLVEENHGPFASFVGHLLTLDPKRRPSCAEALKHSFFDRRYSD